MSKTFGLADLKKHGTKQSAWIAINGQVYDVTTWIPLHPGGEEVLLAYGGQDASDEFNTIHKPGTLEKALQNEKGPKLLGAFGENASGPEDEKKEVKVEVQNTSRHAWFLEPFWISWFKGARSPEDVPRAKQPEEFPMDVQFMFSRMGVEHQFFLWNRITLYFGLQCCCVFAYAGMLKKFSWNKATTLFCMPFAALSMQSVYALHDVMHGAAFPPREWQKFIMYPWLDFISVSWEDLIIMHNRHHASTIHPAKHHEFGYDPAWLLYLLQDYTWLTCPLIPVAHFVGASYTGLLGAIQWFMAFPFADKDGRVDPRFHTLWLPRRINHQLHVTGCWALAWFLGTFPLGRPWRDGWRFIVPITCAARVGASLAWMGIMNLGHSRALQAYLEADAERRDLHRWKVLPYLFGGRSRFADIIFSDVHHAYPNRIGTMGQNSRWHGWEKVGGAAAEILRAGLWKK